MTERGDPRELVGNDLSAAEFLIRVPDGEGHREYWISLRSLFDTIAQSNQQLAQQIRALRQQLRDQDDA